MITWVDVPEVQLIAVILLGFSMGYFFFDRLIAHPFTFTFLSGILFFGIRFIPAYLSLDAAKPGTIPGNGILSAAIMWVAFFGAMLLGRHFVHRI